MILLLNKLCLLSRHTGVGCAVDDSSSDHAAVEIKKAEKDTLINK